MEKTHGVNDGFSTDIEQEQNLVCVESHFKSSCFKNRVKWSCYHLLYCTL